tara:strand:+ start:1770 stop:2105 length:336 start_codon:yes stop_codon:yes gene_type:complete
MAGGARGARLLTAFQAPPDAAIRTARVAVHDGTAGPTAALPMIANDDLPTALECYKAVLGMLATGKDDVTSSHYGLFLAWAMAFKRAGNPDVAAIFSSWCAPDFPLRAPMP